MHMKNNISGKGEECSSHNNKTKKLEIHRGQANKDLMPGSQLWTDGLICALEFIRGHKKPFPSKSHRVNDVNLTNQLHLDGGTELTSQRPKGNNFRESAPIIELGNHQASCLRPDGQNSPLDSFHATEGFEGSHWVPIGWARISELVRVVQVDAGWSTQAQQFDLIVEEDDLTVADLAAPYWERPGGPTWWCHLSAGHPTVDAWLNTAQWLHPAISIALRDESRLISDKMKHLLYEVPVRVAGGLLFELLGQSVGDPYVDEDDIPVVLRSFQAQNFLLSVLHVKGTAKRINVLGITEVQELLLGGGYNTPRNVHEIIANLACRLARWDDRTLENQIDFTIQHILIYDGVFSDLSLPLKTEYLNLQYVSVRSIEPTTWYRKQCKLVSELGCIQQFMLFRKSIFGAADEVELKFMNRRNYEDLNLFGIILNQEIRRLSRQVIRVKWSLHAREEIVFELLQHLRGNLTRSLLEGIRKSTREMIDEQEAVRGRLFTIQDVMQSTIRAWLQDRSLTVTHNLTVFGGCGLVLSIITGLFGINVDGIPGATNTPYAFGLFAALLFFIGMVLIAVGLLYLGLKKPVRDEQVEVRKLELDELVKMFQHEAQTHAQVHKPARHNLPPTAGDSSSTTHHVAVAVADILHQGHVGLSSNISNLNQFRAFCTGQDLSIKNCVPCSSKDLKPMTEEEANALIQQVPGWNLVKEGSTQKLHRSWKVKTFVKGMEFLRLVADVAEAEGHHPDLHLVGWNNVKIDIWTHAVGGVTQNDFILAAKINGLNLHHLLRITPKKVSD
ncbi:hypothetical protein ACJIZ3_013332 [Penstemon smallii]|uniref:4a-hydroxytetrahydrobiopterin dehydratase n=1 Tax=Penstemon smallii TaxID=265156 RepID=A0ABD3UPX1_9LAMI